MLGVSVDQWKYQYRLWTNLQDHQIGRFTSGDKERFKGAAYGRPSRTDLVMDGYGQAEQSAPISALPATDHYAACLHTLV